MQLKSGMIRTKYMVSLSELSRFGNRKHGLFSEILHVEGKSVCTLVGRNGTIESLWFYTGKQRVELKRQADGTWSGKEYKSSANALF